MKSKIIINRAFDIVKFKPGVSFDRDGFHSQSNQKDFLKKNWFRTEGVQT